MAQIDVFKAFLNLITPIKSSSETIYKALYRLLGFVQNTHDQIIAEKDILVYHEIRLEIDGNLATANDVLPVRYIVTLPIDIRNNLLTNQFTITKVIARAKSAPSAADCIIDILVSKDNEVSWKTLFGPTNPQKLVIKQNTKYANFANNFSINVLLDSWPLRVDVLQNGTTSGVSIVIQGYLSPISNVLAEL